MVGVNCIRHAVSYPASALNNMYVDHHRQGKNLKRSGNADDEVYVSMLYVDPFMGLVPMSR